MRYGAAGSGPPSHASRWLLPYIVAVNTAGAALILVTLPTLTADRVPTLLLFVALIALADSLRVPVSLEGEVSLCFVASFAAAVLFGPCFGALVAAGGSIIADAAIRRKGVFKTAFNAGQFAVAGGLAGLVFSALQSNDSYALVTSAPAYAAAALVFLLCNSALVSGVWALFGFGFIKAWTRAMQQGGVLYLAMAPLGALLASAYAQSPWSLLYFPLLVWVFYKGFGLYAKLRTETQNALVALANSLERRDPYTFEHSVRVAGYARHMARQLKLPEEQLELIVSAAQVHDLGKISIDNRILFKAGPLTEDERREVNTHAAAGAELAVQFSMYREGAAIIRGHHERWDGSGYPDGLAGEAIPLGARIIAVADVYDAMTSDRPYRAALPHEVAVAELTDGRGSQFDPEIVDVFLALELTAEACADRLEVQSQQQPGRAPAPRLDSPVKGSRTV